MNPLSALDQHRKSYRPKLLPALGQGIGRVQIKVGAATALRVGAVLSGGQAPGGHNAGIFDSIRAIHKDSVLAGFLGGPGGLEKGQYEIIGPEHRAFQVNSRRPGRSAPDHRPTRE